MTFEIRTHFTKTVADYDTVVDHVVMKNDELHAELLAALNLPLDRQVRVLDIGMGTGHGARLVLEKYPNATLTGLDFSPSMVAKAARTLESFQGRIDLVVADILNYTPAAKFDAVISAVTIHNLSAENKFILLNRLASWIAEGGSFINGDFFRGETDSEDRAMHELYEGYVRSHLVGDELNAWLRHIEEHDKPAKLSEQFQILVEAGFEKPRIIWQFGNEAVYSARRLGERT